MLARRYMLITGIILLMLGNVHAQQDRLAYLFSGVVYDEFYRPLPYTHVVAQGTGSGDVTDSLGIFSIYMRNHDQLSFYNISYRDTSRFVSIEDKGFYIKLEKRYYLLKEARIYNWGSSYEEFLNEVERQGLVVTEGERLELPKQDPDLIPFYLNEKELSSFKYFIRSPLNYLYYNTSKKEKGARKAFQLERDKELIDIFENTLSEENISSLTKLQGKELEQFMLYLNARLLCTYHCSELQLLTEIFEIWNHYQVE